MKCFTCGEADYNEVIGPYDVTLPNDRNLTIAGIKLLRCPKCHQESVPPESSKKIEAAIEFEKSSTMTETILTLLDSVKEELREQAKTAKNPELRWCNEAIEEIRQKQRNLVGDFVRFAGRFDGQKIEIEMQRWDKWR
jgi:DNA repair exonuclease SbcCD ATPase subunit